MHSSDGAGLGRVRVEDLRSYAPDQACEPEGRDQVAQRRDLAAELVDADHRHVSRVRDEGHRVLTTRERAGDEGRLVPARLQTVGQIGDVQRRPTHVQAGDHPQNPNGFRRIRPGQRLPRP